MIYVPKRVLFESVALEYPLGESLHKYFTEKGITTDILKSNRATGIPSSTPQQAYAEGKGTLVVRVRKKQPFQSCKPSAHYQLPLISGCSGKCEYCYLNTRFGNKPYTTIYANIDEILNQADSYIEDRKPDITVFEAAATSDPIPFEIYTGSLKKTIEFIGSREKGRLRLVTKFGQIDSLLDAKHNGNTTIRFSINTDKIIKDYEHSTSTLHERIEGSKKIFYSGYRIGYIIGPVFIYNNWKEEYLEMLNSIKDSLGEIGDKEISFEVISHRFTTSAKNKILEIFPNTKLPMAEEDRQYKYGQFGYGKYVYNKDDLQVIKDFFQEHIQNIFGKGKISYII